jgi:hypothetical protein
MVAANLSDAEGMRVTDHSTGEVYIIRDGKRVVLVPPRKAKDDAKG